MGIHRVAGTRNRRGIAKWPIAVLSLVVLLTLGGLGWSWLGGFLERRAAAEAIGCASGDAAMHIVVAPSVVGTVQQAADAWEETHPVVQDRCIKVDVRAMDSQAVLDNLTGGWNDTKLGPRPTAWLPESSLWANRLSAQNNNTVGSQGESVGSSPVLLALPEAGGTALQTGNGFQWSQLPDLTSSSNAWSRYGQQGWGNLKVAFPDLTTNPAAAMALQSALAGASPQGVGPVTTQMLSVPQVQDTVTRLATTQATGAPNSVTDALTKLGQTSDLASAGFQAVPVFEVDLYRRNLGMDGMTPPKKPLVGVSAGGPNPMADFPFLTVNGVKADAETAGALNRAGQQFGEFLRSKPEQRAFALAGLREPASNEHPSPSPGVRWGATTDNLKPADANTAQQISAAWSDASVGGQVVTALVDVSRSMAQDGGDGKTRIDWLKSAFNGQIDRSLAGSLGLWEFSRSMDNGLPYRQLVATQPVRQQREALHNAVESLQPVSATYTYSSVLAAYRYAMQHYQDGKPNRIVVVTDGPNDGDLSLEQLKTELKHLRESKRPLPISIIALGHDPDLAALDDLAKTTNGRLSVAQDGKAIEPALGQLLSSTG